MSKAQQEPAPRTYTLTLTRTEMLAVTCALGMAACEYRQDGNTLEAATLEGIRRRLYDDANAQSAARMAKKS